MSSGIRIPFHSEFAEQGNLYLLVAFLFFFLVIFYMRDMMVLLFGMIHISINWLLHDEQWKMNIFLQHLMSRGAELFDATLSNEAMHQRGKSGLITLMFLLHDRV